MAKRAYNKKKPPAPVVVTPDTTPAVETTDAPAVVESPVVETPVVETPSTDRPGKPGPKPRPPISEWATAAIKWFRLEGPELTRKGFSFRSIVFKALSSHAEVNRAEFDELLRNNVTLIRANDHEEFLRLW